MDLRCASSEMHSCTALEKSWKGRKGRGSMGLCPCESATFKCQFVRWKVAVATEKYRSCQIYWYVGASPPITGSRSWHILPTCWASELSMTSFQSGRPWETTQLFSFTFNSQRKGSPDACILYNPPIIWDNRQIRTLFIRAYHSWIIKSEWIRNTTLAYK